MTHPFKKSKKHSATHDHSRHVAIIKSTLDSAFAASYPAAGPRAHKLRSSSLPYCPLSDIYAHLTDSVSGWEDSYSALAYTSIGTIVHSLLQNWLPRHASKVKIVGLWSTLPCSTTSKANPDGKPDASCPMLDSKGVPKLVGLDSYGCPRCGKLPVYEEAEANNAFTSHIDWIWLIKGSKTAYIIDIKTTSLKAIYDHRRRDGSTKFPQYNYVAQTDSYLVQMRGKLKKLGYKLGGSMLLYIPRDKPDNYELLTIRKNLTKQWFRDTKATLDRVAAGYQLVSPLIKSDTTLKATTMSDLLPIVEHKLCTSTQDYLTNYDPRSAYKGNEPCPLLDVCFKSKQLKAALKEAVNSIKPAKTK